MHPFKIPSAVLDAIAHEHWGRSPAVWRAPNEVPYATPEAVLAALRGLHARLDGGDTATIPRVYADGQPVGFRMDEHLPAEGEGFDAWEARVAAWARGRELGMLVSEVQSLGGDLWWSAVAVARALYERRGVTPGGAHSEIFFGNYRKSFFGVHKDSLETVTFVLRGRKRFLVWPYEVFADRPEVFEGAEASQVNLDPELDYGPHRDRAVVLEGGPGDVFFWPASYWHVAEGVDDAFVTTATVAFFPSASRASGCPFRIANEAISRFAVDGFSSADPPYAAPTSAGGVRAIVDGLDATLRRLLDDETVRRARREFGLMWATAYGFRRVPEEGPAPALDPADVFEVDAENPLRWLDGEDAGFPTSVNGLVVTATPAFLPLVEHLNKGGRFVVGELVAAFARDTLSEQDVLDALGALGSVRFYELVAREGDRAG
ncbi:MAG: hypothetical protein JWM10_1505 [Myxococcaceae bacterium]|nr:hypothetical protein [Myxococcaceae bacterium]